MIEELKTAQVLTRWVTALKAALPKVTVERHLGVFDVKELERLSVKVPAVYVSALNGVGGTDLGDNRQGSGTIFAAYIITGGQYRDTQGLNLSEVVRVLLKKLPSGVDGVYAAKKISWKSVVSDRSHGQGIALNVVGWQQEIVLGDPSDEAALFASGLPWPDGVVPGELYIHEL